MNQRMRYRCKFGARFQILVLLVVVALLAAACVDTGTDDPGPTETDDVSAAAVDDASDGVATEEDTELLIGVLGFASEEDADLPEVHTESLVAETPTLTLRAQAWENTFVGEAAEGLFVGIALDSPYASDASEVRVYVCDGEGTVSRFASEIEDGRATLADDDVVVEFLVAESEITGTVEPTSDSSHSFKATPATGDAGVFVSTDSVDDGDIWGGWIVLHDGRQQGSICFSAFDYSLCLLAVEGPSGKVVRK